MGRVEVGACRGTPSPEAETGTAARGDTLEARPSLRPQSRRARWRGRSGAGGDRGGRGDRDKRRDARPDREPREDAERAKKDVPAPAPAAAVGCRRFQARLFVNLGKKHGVSADDLRTLLAGPLGGDTARIGAVSLRDSHAHVRVPEDLVETIISGVHGTTHAEQQVTVERARVSA